MKKTPLVLVSVLVTSLTTALAGPAAAAPAAVPGDLRQIQTRQSLLGSHTWYQQTYRGIPVFGGYYATHRTTDGTVTTADGRKTVTGLTGTAARLSEQRARSTVAGRLGSQPARSELVVFPGPTAKLAWQTLTPTARGTVRSLLDAGSGTVLLEENTAREANGTGQVFDPNPVVALQDESLTDQDDTDHPALKAAYRRVTLRHLDPDKDTLQGSYANNLSEPAVTSAPRTYVYPRSDPGFEQVMTYYSMTAAQDYLHRLGFIDVNNEPQDYRTTGFTADNSYYDPSVDAITLGTGGVDDAEDNEVIWHELGHAIQDDQVPGFGSTVEAGAIGEGFGDYWAVTMSQATSPDTAVTPLACVMDWDATSYTDDEPHCLRRTDTAKLYPGDLVGQVHADGEIWSHALWDINQALGRTRANRIILEAQFRFTPDVTMPQAAEATVATARVLHGPRAAAQTRKAFQARGILS
ncbi:M36 family metallopeptidase [Couchioplanes caeruleus]|uniref:Bacillolysin n=2 Tax=Couchioplanes caeruleus TaxID=56438 RepID=A0A1K0GED4_9ACTN|nr:M36 family metallopeptidase [Couchioplanes caeruleus]OJF10510.1 bacillolysin [Couchioplanes caeruleus subsp. caeruleus]ROP28595.1 Zn-dependent metalloprotease [Couchioplanes caeruleus]